MSISLINRTHDNKTAKSQCSGCAIVSPGSGGGGEATRAGGSLFPRS